MRCRPGDLARVVPSPGDPFGDFNYGKLVEVVRPADGHWSGPSDWECIALGDLICGDGVVRPRGSVVGCLDSELKPMRDPGDDARDEMLRPLPQEVAA